MSHPIIKFVDSVCVQTAVYWGSPVPDGYGGSTYADRREIKCRWDGKAKLMVGADGKEFVTQAEIMVVEDLDLDGYLFLGTTSDLTFEQQQDPSKVPGARKIRSIETTPLFRSTTDMVITVYV